MAEEETTQKMTRNQRYHLLNRESRLQKQREQYNNNPDIILKRMERERIKAEKETEKIAKKEAEKEAKQAAAKAEKEAKKSNASPTKKAKKEVVEDEEEEKVKKIEYEGKKYLKSLKTGVIYDYEKYKNEGDPVVVGMWIESENKIKFEDAEESEEEYDE